MPPIFRYGGIKIRCWFQNKTSISQLESLGGSLSFKMKYGMFLLNPRLNFLKSLSVVYTIVRLDYLVIFTRPYRNNCSTNTDRFMSCVTHKVSICKENSTSYVWKGLLLVDQYDTYKVTHFRMQKCKLYDISYQQVSFSRQFYLHFRRNI
jgi:hypothetical protein